MLKRFLTYITEKALFLPEEKILLAVSGGMDSVVMAHLFHQAKCSFAIVHCNFGLRGEESDADEAFVKKLAKKYKVACYTEQFETEAFARQEKVSIQMAARMLRYEWFERLLTAEGFAYLATAHHQNDVLETVLFNLTKGTGISGLHGIRPKFRRVIRPLLFADRDSIYEYVVENQLAWREDSSNQSSKYHRNLIRNEVVPLLKQINPNLEGTIAQTVEKVSAVENSYEAELDRLRGTILQSDGETTKVHFGLLGSETEPVIKLFGLLKPFHFSYEQVLNIWQALNAEPGKQFDSPTHLLIKDRTELIITPKKLNAFRSALIEKEQTTFEHEGIQLKAEIVPVAGYRISTSPKIAALSLETLQFPLKLRRWKEGDWFCPLGMTQKKKLSDFLIDEKVPLNLKDQVWVLLSGDSIVWVLGRRIDNRFKLTEKTEQVYQLTLG